MDSPWSQTRLLRSLGDWSYADDRALFRSLADRLRAQITTGHIPSGVRLPSERTLASALGVSRSTVVAAFDELRADGLISSRQGSGTRVTRAGMHRRARGESRLDSFARPATPAHRIDLRSAALPGLPFVVDAVAHLDPGVIADLVALHGYSPGGLAQLRTAVARYYSDLALPTTSDQVLVTSGAQQALRLVAATVLEPGAKVIVEEPTFRGAIETLRSVGARLVTVPSGAEGVDLRSLERILRDANARMVFVQASGHNPTGSVLSEDRRDALAELCARAGVLLVEDAAVLDASIDAEPGRPVAGPGQIVTIGSASKSFWGGLRVGWLRADPRLIGHLTVAKGSEDLGTSLLAQVVTADLLSRVGEARILRRAALSEARAVLLDGLARELPEWEPTIPRAGASLWARIPGGSATAFSQYAARHGVQLLAGPTFSAHDDLDDHIRVAFATTPEVVASGVAALGRLWADYRPAGG